MKKQPRESLIDSGHLSQTIHFLKDPEIVYPSKISKIKPKFGDRSWYVTTSKSCNYTNNPFLCKRDFFKEHILPHLSFGENIEDRLILIWKKENHKCIIGPGRFTHDRSYDGHS